MSKSYISIYVFASLMLSLSIRAQEGNTSQPEAKPKVDACPDFKSKPKKSSRADYLKFMRTGKPKTQVADPNTSNTKHGGGGPAQTTEPETAAKSKRSHFDSDFFKKKEPAPTQSSEKIEVPPTKAIATIDPKPVSPPSLTPAKQEEKVVPIAKDEIKSKEPDSPIAINEDQGKNEPAVATNTSAETKKTKSKFWTRVKHKFSKRDNKRAKPNYKKCPTLS